MTQSSDDGLLLNVTSGTNKKKKLNGSSGSFQISDSENSRKFKKNTPKSISKFNDELGSEYSKSKKLHAGKGKVSSLFANNPEIPEVMQKDVKEITEPVFSNNLFKNIGIHPFTVSNLEQNFNITETTTVQELSIPILLSGKDALIRSQTGSGKTLAYAIPVVDSLQKIRPKLSRNDGVKVLVVLPTRELALQTYECFIKLVKSFTWLVPGLLTGGEKRKSEKARLRKGVTILIGTPGRLLDHAKHTKALHLNAVQWLILDEADRLLDMGYEKDVASLIGVLETQQNDCNNSEVELNRQTVLLSATLTPKVEQLAGLTLKSPVRIDASSNYNEDDEVSHLVIPKSLRQCYVITPPKLRLVTLAAVVHWKCRVEQGGGKMLIFMATQDMVDFHIELLSTVLSDSAKYFRLHGSMMQEERTQIFKTFREANSGVLLCTDVAARGLDLPHVDWIVQFTAPTTPSDYVHRVGRTARVGHKGSALLFLAPSETQFLSLLEERFIKLDAESVDNCLQNIRLMEIPGAEDIQRAKMGGPTVEAAATALQLQFESAVLEQKGLHEVASKGYISWVRFYASYPKDFREVFNFKNLHLGHYAKSFALRDPPSMIGGIGRPKFRKLEKRSIEKPPMNKQKLSFKHSAISEFDSGLSPRKKKKKDL